MGSCAGFSFTHAVPMCDGRALPGAVRRINVGGKALTNYFKELVSYRRASSSVCVLFCNTPIGYPLPLADYAAVRGRSTTLLASLFRS